MRIMARTTTHQKATKFYAYVPDENGNEPKVVRGDKRLTPGRTYFQVTGVNPHHKAHKRAQNRLKVGPGEYELFQYWDIRDIKSFKKV